MNGYVQLFYTTDGKRQDEGALQAYFFRRLNDRLPGRVPSARASEIDLSREHQGNYLRRKDILIKAACLGGANAEVAVEIKWSSNRETSTSLRQQLCDKYLVAEGRTHGIYLVAWDGHCAGWRSAGEKTNPKALQQLSQALERQANATIVEIPAVRINPVVFDLEWIKRKPQKKASSKLNGKASARKAASRKPSKRASKVRRK